MNTVNRQRVLGPTQNNGFVNRNLYISADDRNPQREQGCGWWNHKSLLALPAPIQSLTACIAMLCIMASLAFGETTVLRGAAQGTTYHIKLIPPASGIDEHQLKLEIEQALARIDEQMSTYRQDSELSKFNRAPAGEWFPVSPAVVKVVEAARAISEKTNGAMDVTVGPLVRLWHFGPPEKARRASDKNSAATSKKKRDFRPPTDDELAAVRKRIGYKLLETRDEPPALKKTVDGLEVDLSSIASGYTIDQLASILTTHGVKDFMVELGGEVRAAGTRDDGSPWRIAIERPVLDRRELEVAVPLKNASLATAGGTHKFFEFDGKRYSHIIDPSTGRPVKHALASVSVAADTCLEADGWDTPLTVLGADRGIECADKNGIAAMFIVPADNSNEPDTIKTTKAWRKRFGDQGGTARK